MLKAMLEKEKYESLDDGIKEHYTEKDGKYVLAVTKVDGLSLENVDGLKRTVETLRASEKSLQTEVKVSEDALKVSITEHKEFAVKYEGIDPEAAKEAIGKIDDIKNWDGEKKVREAVQVAVQAIEQKAKFKMEEVVKQHTTKADGLQTELKASQGQLQEAIVSSKIVEAISKANGNVDVLMPHVKNQVVMIKDSHGLFKPEVQNKDGNPRVNNDGADMTIIQLVEEMKTQDTFAACFSGANQSGSGHTGSSATGSHKKTGEGKTVAASDTKAMSDNLEDIATGKVKVDMSK